MSAHAIHLQALYIQARVEGFDGLAEVFGELLRREVAANQIPISDTVPRAAAMNAWQ
jgi:hypothetical protein